MANETILNYLRGGLKRGFNISDLRSKLIEANYPEGQIREAIEILKTENAKEKEQEVLKQQNDLGGKYKGTERTMGNQQSSPRDIAQNRGKNFKLMNLGGVSGMILISLIILLSILIGGILKNVIAINVFSILLWILLAGVFICFMTLYISFVKLGKETECKVINVGAIGQIISVMSGIVLTTVIFIFSSNLTVFDIDNLKAGTIMAPALLIIFICGLLIILFMTLFEIILSIGLIKINKKVRFAKSAGILNILFILGCFITLVIYIATMLIKKEQIASANFEIGLGAGIGLIISGMLKLLGLSFQSLALFDESKKAE